MHYLLSIYMEPQQPLLRFIFCVTCIIQTGFVDCYTKLPAANEIS